MRKIAAIASQIPMKAKATGQDADIGGNSFAALEPQPNRKRMTEKGAEAGGERRIATGEPGGKEDGGGSLQRVEQEGGYRQCLATGAQHVGGADIARADVAHVAVAGELGQ
jgi:hypothetical protein